MCNKNKKIKAVIALTICLEIFLTGCGNLLEDIIRHENFKHRILERRRLEQEQKEEEYVKKQEMAVSLPEERFQSSIIQEDENYIYICSSFRIVKIDKEEMHQEILWENKNASKGSEEYIYETGCGLLIGDKIFFVEEAEDEDGWYNKTILSVINIDGSGHKKLYDFEFYSSTIFFYNGELIVADGKNTWYFAIEENGDIRKVTANDSANEKCFVNLEQGYSSVYYQNNGCKELLVAECLEKLGYWIVRNKDYELVKWKPETGEEVLLGGSLVSFSEQYILISKWEENAWNVYKIDSNTFEKELLVQYDTRQDVITADDEYLYVRGNKETGFLYYEKVSLKDGTKTEIFRQKQCEIGFYSYNYIMDCVCLNGYIYYVGEKNYNFYVVRRSIDNPSRAEILGEAFYETGISEVGVLRSYHESIYSKKNPELLLGQIDLSWLEIDKRFLGAKKINVYLARLQSENVEYERESVKWMNEELEEEDEIYWPAYSYSSVVSHIDFFNNTYVSFCQEEYDYMGGAHGMPYRVGLTFDLNTGERLFLQDIVKDSEVKLKETITAYFAQKIEADPDGFWDDAIETVRTYAGYDSSFYLTEEGIVFYYAPYYLSCYAAGFQTVVIPYEEFDMKINVDSDSQILLYSA